jgi:hypothetical protein
MTLADRMVGTAAEARLRVFVARRLPQEGLAAIAALADADVWDDELPPPRDELLRRVAGYDGIVTLLTDRVDDELLDAAGRQLRVASNYAAGFDNVDVPASSTRRAAPSWTPTASWRPWATGRSRRPRSTSPILSHSRRTIRSSAFRTASSCRTSPRRPGSPGG